MEPDRAAQHLTASLERSTVGGVRRVGRWAVALVEAAFGSVPTAPDVDLVVRRIGSGAEVLRTHANVGDPEELLATVRADLAEKSVTEFVAEWRGTE